MFIVIRTIKPSIVGSFKQMTYFMFEQTMFNIVTLSFDDNKILKVQLDMLIFVQLCGTID